MRELLQAASRALSANDAGTLERLAASASSGQSIEDHDACKHARDVLAAQVDAAAAHLALRSRVLAASETYEVPAWAR